MSCVTAILIKCVCTSLLGSLNAPQKRALSAWKKEIGNQDNRELSISEDEGIFSPELPNSCSSRDMYSVMEMLSDDDQASVRSLSVDSGFYGRIHTGK